MNNTFSFNRSMAFCVAVLGMAGLAISAGARQNSADEKGATLLLRPQQIAQNTNPVPIYHAPLPEYLPGEILPPKDEPKVMDPGPPPSDAIVLFDGSDLSKWANDKGGPAKWEVKDGVLTVTKTGWIHTRQAFGDCQLHVEWATPAEVKGDGQGRGNSGIFLQGQYEIQVLDSYNNPTYFHGQAGAVYRQHAPLVNACRKPGEWQTYDIIYHGPQFEADGKVAKAATVTVLQNGVLVQDHTTILGSTAVRGAPRYIPHSPKEPLTLQDHGNPVRYRNIWIREL